MCESEVVYGTFKTEIKNRFLCTVCIDGVDTLCYVPSSCRLSNFINMDDRKVMLLPIKKKDARTRYSVCAIKYRKSYVPIGLSFANQIIEENIHRRIFSFLGSRKEVVREKTIDGYKSDIYISDTDTVIEIKSILSFEKDALFPTVFSERANRQLEDIRTLLQKGHKVCYMLVSLYSGVKQISINEAQTEYQILFRKCEEIGMKVCGCTLCMEDNKPRVKKIIDCQV